MHIHVMYVYIYNSVCLRVYIHIYIYVCIHGNHSDLLRKAGLVGSGVARYRSEFGADPSQP